MTAIPPRLRCVTYNACLLPFPVAHNGKWRVSRMCTQLPHMFADADVLVLCELISCSRTRALLKALAPTWPYQSAALTQWGRVSGGVRILSKHPILAQSTHVYTTSEARTSDMLAAKGVVYCKLDTPHGRVHVFGTHMHAPDTESGHAVRLAQVRELHRFVRAQHIAPNECVLLGGDFNMDMDGEEARRALRVRAPKWHEGTLAHTIDEATNVLVGQDGSCKRGDGSCLPRLLDGVYAHAGYARNAVVYAHIVRVEHKGRDLSDHHAVCSSVSW